VALRRARLRALFSPFVQFVGFGTIALVMWIGGRQVLAGSLTAGELVTFLLYTLTVAGAIGAFTGLYGQLQEALGASRRIFELLGERSDISDPATPATLETVAGRITFEDVGFRYSDRDVDVLDSVNLEVAPGEVVALVGPSGAGKSTIVQLIPRFFDPTSGRILIDGVDLRDLRLRDLRSYMAAVPQETQLFSGTIMENLLLGEPDATPAEVRAAAVAANAHDFIESFPSGYDTIVGERGAIHLWRLRGEKIALDERNPSLYSLGKIDLIALFRLCYLFAWPLVRGCSWPRVLVVAHTLLRAG